MVGRVGVVFVAVVVAVVVVPVAVVDVVNLTDTLPQAKMILTRRSNKDGEVMTQSVNWMLKMVPKLMQLKKKPAM